MIKRSYFLLITILFSIETFANTPCGSYSVSGKVLRSENEFFIIVNEKSASEYRLKVLENDLPKIVPYLDKELIANVKISKKMIGYAGVIASIQDIERFISNPLTLDIENRLIIKSKTECEK